MKVVSKYCLFVLALLLTLGIRPQNCQLNQEEEGSTRLKKEHSSRQLPPNVNLSKEKPADEMIGQVIQATSDNVHAQGCIAGPGSPIRVISYKWGHGTDVLYYFVKFEFFGKFWVVKIVRVIPTKPRVIDLRLLENEHEEIYPF